MIKTVIFDMDGLLIDSEPFWRKAEIAVFEGLGIHLTDDDCRETMGYRLNDVVALWYGRKPWTGKSLTEVEVEILEKVSRYIISEGKALPGIMQAISQFKALGLKMAIASSSPMKLINSVVQLLKMEGKFDALHSAQFEEYGKPHPAVFIHTAKLLDVDPEHCLVFEDSFHGVVAALAAKMKVVAIPEKDSFKDARFKAAHRVLSTIEAFDFHDLQVL